MCTRFHAIFKKNLPLFGLNRELRVVIRLDDVGGRGFDGQHSVLRLVCAKVWFCDFWGLVLWVVG